jgi:hypothetical protein
LNARTGTGRAHSRRGRSSQALAPPAATALCNRSPVPVVIVVLCRGDRSGRPGPNAPSVQQGLFPEWFGCREILHHRDPYRPEATRQIELAVFGRTQTESAAPLNQHRFAYPVFFVFLFFPIALLPFGLAEFVALLGCIGLTAASIPSWLKGRQFSNLDKLTFAIFALASYPVVLGLQLRQPTLIVASLLAAVLLLCALGPAGTGRDPRRVVRLKPQLAIASCFLCPSGRFLRGKSERRSCYRWAQRSPLC